MAESYNGWPASSNKSEIGVVQSEWFPGGAKEGDVTTVLRYVAEQLNARVEPIVGGTCWGYSYRANANNPNSLSCHASGTAIDWNAPQHPNGAYGTFTDAQVGEIYAILNEVEGAIHWLNGDDGGTADQMHFEVCVDANTLAGVAARIGGRPAPGPGPSPEPETEAAPQGVTMFVVIDSVACIALCNNVMFQFTDWNTFTESRSASPDVPMLVVGGSEPIGARQHLHSQLFAQHVAAVG
jgi:hypothetical protein